MKNKKRRQQIEVEYISVIEPKGEECYVAIATMDFDNYMDAKAFIEGLPEVRILTEVSQLPTDGTNFTTKRLDNEIMMSDVD